MEYTSDGEPKGFDPANDIALADALNFVMGMHETARPLTVRKFIVGIAIHGNESGITAFAGHYEESYVRLDRTEPNVYRASPERFAAIPCDFWRIGMAIDENAGGCFANNNLGHITEMTASELPYRMRDMTHGELQNERVNLAQSAWGVHFPRHSLIALADDPEWQAWGHVALALQNRGKRGRPHTWKWDEVKAALTIEAARNPDILSGGSGPIIQFINDAMRQMHFEQLPDIKDVEAYARRFSGLWSESDLGPPAD